MNSVISVSDFYFNYLRSDLVLKNVNIEIEKGSFTVIIGPSGAGKTTLCKAMTGIVPFYSGGDYAGEIKVLGESTKGKKVSDLAMKVGLMLEDYESQLVSLTAGEEVAFSLLNHGFPPEEAEERTRLALEDVGLPGRESYQLDELSGGQRQRLALASLDKIHKEHGTTFIVVEHRLEFVLPYMTDLIAVKNGEIAAQGHCEDVVPHIYEDEELRALLPDLWQIKCNLEKGTAQKFNLWRSAEEAVKELQSKGFGRGVRA